jgi:hypothetical protein
MTEPPFFGFQIFRPVVAEGLPQPVALPRARTIDAMARVIDELPNDIFDRLRRVGTAREHLKQAVADVVQFDRDLSFWQTALPENVSRGKADPCTAFQSGQKIR